jgi:hypothetical protein
MLVLVAVLVLVVPTAVADRPQPIGEQIRLYGPPPPPETFTADTPFHIAHGWANDPTWGVPIGRFDFQLEVDDVYWDEDFFITERVFDEKDGVWKIRRLWVYNFPEGMPEGEVKFKGHWLAPCEAAQEYHGYTGDCDKRNEIVEVYLDEITVEFNQ